MNPKIEENETKASEPESPITFSNECRNNDINNPSSLVMAAAVAAVAPTSVAPPTASFDSFNGMSQVDAKSIAGNINSNLVNASFPITGDPSTSSTINNANGMPMNPMHQALFHSGQLQEQQQQQQQQPLIQLGSYPPQQQQQQQQQQLHLIQPNGATIPTLPQGTSAIMTGPNGQQVILGASAAAALFSQQNQVVNPAQQQQPQQVYTMNTTQQPQQQLNMAPIPSTTNTTTTTRKATRGTKRKTNTTNCQEGNTTQQRYKVTNDVSSTITPSTAQSSNNPNTSLNSSSASPNTSTSNMNSFQFNSTIKTNTTPGEERRRVDRNQREQQRSQKISHQIKELRTVLTESQVPFKPNKFSILMSVAEYIKQLQARAALLDNEHRKLINTIRQTNEIVNSGAAPSLLEDQMNNEVVDVGSEAEMIFVQGIDYKAVFDQCSAALGVAALDGQFLACNAQFADMFGQEKQVVEKDSLFHMMSTPDVEDILMFIDQSLKKDVATGGAITTAGDNTNAVTVAPTGHEDKKQQHRLAQRYWKGKISQQHQDLNMNITLTRTADGKPKFFSCALSVSSEGDF